MIAIFSWPIVSQLAVQRNGLFSFSLKDDFKRSFFGPSSGVDGDRCLRIRNLESFFDPISTCPVDGSGVAALNVEHKCCIVIKQLKGRFFLSLRLFGGTFSRRRIFRCFTLPGSHLEGLRVKEDVLEPKADQRVGPTPTPRRSDARLQNDRAVLFCER